MPQHVAQTSTVGDGIVAIDTARIVEAGDGDALEGRRLHALHTEGHARHHYCLDDTGSAGVFTHTDSPEVAMRCGRSCSSMWY